MSIEWQEQLREFINTVEKNKQYIKLTPEEDILQTTKTTWGTIPLFCLSDGP